jgi:PAS domain S-box-containing protein
VLGGKNLDSFDLPMLTTSGDRLWVSVSTSTVLAEHGAVILSFRDVTSERRLEAELRKTKEFLEKLIDSTVDAIIAADIGGTIILYNPGAERIFGYPAEEVIGRLSVEKLYPEGVARQIMRMLRSQSYGGVGRLELTRREILTAAGDIVPVNMTASVIYEDGREVATVGILSDLRERIRIEQRLLLAQEKLLITEKQAVVAELAGAAAHELNQPLTSVTLYVEMMTRRMAPDDVNQRAVQAIAREVARMAEIVKKIGRITRYETKQYVGGAAILDLEKSSPDATIAPPPGPGDDGKRR